MIQLKTLQKDDNDINQSINNYLKELDSITPKTIEIGQKRNTLSKLKKDYERLKPNIAVIVTDSRSLQATVIKSTLSNPTNGTSSSSNNINIQPMTSSSSSTSSFREQPNSQQQQQTVQVLQPSLKGREVDEAILEERQKDIMKMNQDLLLVKEMMT